jgi:hypothetical protein
LDGNASERALRHKSAELPSNNNRHPAVFSLAVSWLSGVDEPPASAAQHDF